MTSQLPPAPIDRITTANPSILQTGHSDIELDGRPPTYNEDIIHTEMILGCESAKPISEPSPASMDIAITANPGMQIELSDGEPDGRRLGVLLSEGTPTGYSHSRNSPGRETESHIEIPLIVCEPEIAPQFNEEQQSIGGGGRTLTVPTTDRKSVV